MSETTPKLQLPYLLPSQAQKHVTHNESLQVLDALAQLSVKDRDLSAAPSTPDEGDRYIVGSAASGEWSSHDSEIASFMDGSWRFHAAQTGWLCWIEDEAKLTVWSGTAWVPVLNSDGTTNGFTQLGINTSADSTNRLSVKANATLFSHDDVTPGTGDMRQLINKAAPGNTAATLFQSGFSGRAEMGIAGDDNWRLKVSSDGVVWREAVAADRATGTVTLGSGARVNGPLGVGRPGSVPGGIYFNRNPDNPFLAYSAGDPAGTMTDIGQFRASLASTVIGITGPTGTPYLVACNTSTQRVGILTTTPSNTLSVAGIAAPETDNAFSCGTAAKRWATVYAATGTINTSDRRDKVIIDRPGQAAGRIVDAVEPVLFRWRVGANDVEGDAEIPRAGARLHAGWLAQDVKAALDAEGLDCAAWGLDNAADPDSRQWLRPDEMTALLWEAVRQVRRQLAQLEDFMTQPSDTGCAQGHLEIDQSRTLSGFPNQPTPS